MAEANTPKTSRKRRWFFRLAAMALGLSIFVVIELLCIVFDWGRPSDYQDPYVGFSKVYPLFVLDDDGRTYRTSPSRRRFFDEETFPVDKDGAFRIFVFGGSTVEGEPFGNQTSFTRWLELSLHAAQPDRKYEVVNCGGVSYASYRLIPILKECCQYEPDLFIICSGHNEFLESRTYDHIKFAAPALRSTGEVLSRFRSFVLYREALLRLTGKRDRDVASERPVLRAEVDARLDHPGGLDAYTRDLTWQRGVIEHYEYNLRRMVSISRNAGIPVLLMRPPSNLADCLPFKSEHREGLNDAELHRWNALIDQASKSVRGDSRQTIELLQQAVEIDDQYALTFYELGTCYEAVGNLEQARAMYWKARELDICPLRMLATLEQRLARVAEDLEVPLVDAFAVLEEQSPGGILGSYLLVDHIHPSFRGHQLIASELAREMARQGWISIVQGWESRRDQRFAEHFASLPEIYFLRGQERLRGLRGWTQGKALGRPIERPKNPAVPRES